ncbi:MAG: hypothetical protein RSG92_15155 [Pseudomonas sp.]
MSIVDTLLYIFEGDASRLDRTVEDSDRSVQDLERHLGAADRAASTLGEGFIGLAKGGIAALAAAVSVGAIAAMVTATVDHVDALNDQAEALGVAVSALDAWDAAAAKTGGQAGAFAGSLAQVNERAQEAARKGSAELLAMFSAAGVSATALKANLQDPIALLTEMGDTFEKLSAAEAAGLGKKLGLDPGTINLLREGKTGLQELIREQERLGVVNAEQAEAAGKFNDSMDEAKRIWDDVRRRFVLFILPVLSRGAELFGKLGQVVKENSTFVAFGIAVVAAAVTGLLVPALSAGATAAWALIAPLLPIIAVVGLVGAAIALVAEDLYQFQMGNDSVTGQLAKKWPVIKTIIDVVAASLVYAIAFLTEFASALGTLLDDGPQAAFDQLSKAITSIGDTLKEQFPELAEFIDVLSAMASVVTVQFYAIVAVGKYVFGVLWEVGRAAFNGLATAASVAWTVISGIFRALVALINEGPKAAFEVLTTSAQSAFDRIGRGLTAAGEIFRTVSARIRDALDWIMRRWNQLATTIGDGGILGSLLKAGGKVLSLAVSGASQLAGANATGAAAGAMSPAAIANRNSSKQTTVSVGEVNVHTQATDAKGVASAVGDSLKGELRSAADAADDGIAA